MSKKNRRKRRKSKHRAPNISPLTLLRPRLDALLGDEAFAEKDSQAIKADLDALFEGLKTYDSLPVLIRAYHSAGGQTQDRLDETVPGWLDERGYAEPLLTLLERHNIYEEGRERAVAWLKAAGVDPAVFQEMEQQSYFYRADAYSDDSQGTIVILWYTDHRRRNVRGMNFLVDYNPPWEGATKDIMHFPTRAPEEAVREYVDFWKQRPGRELVRISDAEVKEKILKSLEVNRREGIRLPQDLIRARYHFLRHVLTLPDTPETPPFTAKDFDELSRRGKSAEGIMLYERTVGRRVRMEDGKELLVMGDPLGEDDWL